jgi:tripartite-type tricarboxylate transporter receptor subunit TctC
MKYRRNRTLRPARVIVAVIVALTSGAAVSATAQAQTPIYPARPVMVVVPFAAGGGNDIMARLIAERMGRALGQTFVIENRGGAAGTIGARAVAKAPADGYTLMVGHSGLFAMAPGLYGTAAGFDPRHDFAPVGLIASFQQLLLVHPSLPVHSVADLIALARKEPGRITYASAGIGSGAHVSSEFLSAMAAIKLTHVPYRGAGPAIADLVGGHVMATISAVPPSIQGVRAGLLRAIAVTGDKRLPILPDVPMVTEAGVPGYVAVIHYGMVAPAGTPRATIERLNAALNAALASEDVRARIVDDGGDVLGGTPDRQATDIDQEETKWGTLVRRLGLKPE